MKMTAGATRRVIVVRRWGRWWKPWDIRGTVTIADLSGLHELTPPLAKRLTDYDLHMFPHVRTSDAVAHSIIKAEMRRREGKTARLALAVSIVAVVISFVALFIRKD